MPAATDLREVWRARSATLCPMMDLTEEGPGLGAGTVLVQQRSNAAGRPELALDGAETRVLILLAVAYGKAVEPRVLGNIHRASAAWGLGETALAPIHLARSGLPRLPDGDNAPFRLFAAERLLADGLPPRALLTACGLGTGPLDLLKAGFNPDEPRVPAGNPDGGQWTSEGAESNAAAPHRPGGRFAPANPAPAIYTPADYTPVNSGPVEYTVVPGTPSDAVVVKSPDGKPPIKAGNPLTTLIAPPHANFHTVYAAGRAIAPLPLSSQIPRIYAALHHGGTYDFQRDVPRLKLYLAYIPAANYAVGVYMAGAGYSLWETTTLARFYSLEASTTILTEKAKDWITRGWGDAHSG